MSPKPCIHCGKECEILPVQLGDFFTLTYLRVCSGECMFIIAYDYLHGIGYHKSFRNALYDKQDVDDAKARKRFVDEVTQDALKNMSEHLEASPNLLSTPAPECILKMFEGVPPIPNTCGRVGRFTRPSKEEKIRWQTEHVERLKENLREALHDLEKLEKD